MGIASPVYNYVTGKFCDTNARRHSDRKPRPEAPPRGLHGVSEQKSCFQGGNKPAVKCPPSEHAPTWAMLVSSMLQLPHPALRDAARR